VGKATKKRLRRNCAVASGLLQFARMGNVAPGSIR